MVSWFSTRPCPCQQHTDTQNFIQGFLCSPQHLAWCCLCPRAPYMCSLHSSPCLLLSARWRQRTLEAYSGGDREGKRINILGFVVCGLCGNHTTKAPRQPSTAQPLGVVPAQILFPQANNTVEVWTCFLEGLNINIPAAMVVATPCNTSDSDLYL